VIEGLPVHAAKQHELASVQSMILAMVYCTWTSIK